MHTNTHGYVGKHIIYKKVCMVDDGLEKLIKVIDIIDAQASHSL